MPWKCGALREPETSLFQIILPEAFQIGLPTTTTTTTTTMMMMMMMMMKMTKPCSAVAAMNLQEALEEAGPYTIHWGRLVAACVRLALEASYAGAYMQWWGHRRRQGRLGH